MLPVGTILGRLKIDKVFIEYEGPQLFACSDDRKRRRHLLAVHAPKTEDGDNWLYVYIGVRRLKKVADGTVELHAAFSQPEDGNIRVVCFGADKIPTVRVVKASQVRDDWLPMRGEHLGEHSAGDNYATELLPPEDYLLEAVADIIARDELPIIFRIPAPMWEFDPVVIDYLRKMRTPVTEASRRTGRVVFDVIFKPRGDRAEMPARALGSFLVSTQNVVEALTPPLPLGAKGVTASELARLDALPAFPGSFGIRLDTRDANLFPDPRIIQALDRMAALLSTAEDRNGLRSLLKEVGHRAASRFRLFVDALAKSDSDIAVEIGIPNRPDVGGASLSRREVHALAEFLKAEAAATEETFTFRGLLVGVTIETKYFALEDDERIVSGRIAETALASMFGRVIGSLYDANITVITEINEASGNEKNRYILNSLEPVVA